MNNYLKIVLIFLGVIVGIILLLAGFMWVGVEWVAMIFEDLGGK